jgi:hypothetical protein
VKWFGIGGESDVQVYGVLFSILYLVYYGIKSPIKIPKNIFGVYIWVCVGLVIGILFSVIGGGLDFSLSLRYFATYISLILISLTAYLVLKKEGGIREARLKIIINCYLVVGMIQRLVFSEFAYDIVANARTTSNRGAISLCSEPSFYGYMCIFFMILALDFKKQRLFYLLNLLFQIVFIAKSAITILYLLIFVGVFFICSLNKISLKKILLIIGIIASIVAVSYYFLTSENNNQRVTYFIKTIITQRDLSMIISTFSSDTSVYTRFTDIWICIKGFATRFGLPYGFNTKKISSGYGSLIYTMGWIGVMILYKIASICYGAFSSYKLKRAMPIFLSIILFSAIQVSNPAFAFLVGYFTYKNIVLGKK